ncbi:ATP-dependent metallopeptidase HflB subfamily protein [Cardiosporidium cionae]|uniref:ATP-dependent metallopeptidase HflB subfamily protein n=1 Tax=Cardiosporidium cionae TaxID=476202 RepID=A0ABQ7JG33_9APIC|nr:ATP-dependent metallopeptidase HflB subfamily protein [Cardiosporidium cionae]|eukprot:KAF8822926.1 ATP-dependent metallopeptidase HflB subfamily protein [Cardiosporidium cionae]
MAQPVFLNPNIQTALWRMWQHRVNVCGRIPYRPFSSLPSPYCTILGSPVVPRIHHRLEHWSGVHLSLPWNTPHRLIKTAATSTLASERIGNLCWDSRQLMRNSSVFPSQASSSIFEIPFFKDLFRLYLDKASLLRQSSAIVSILNCRPPKGFEKFYPKSEREKDASKSGSDSNNNDDKSNKNKSTDPARIFWISLYVGLFLLWAIDIPTFKNEITFKEFLSDYLSKGYVDKVQVVNKDYCRVILRQDAPLPSSICFRISSAESFENRLEQFQTLMGLHPKEFIPVQYVQEVSLWNEMKSFIPYALIFVAVSFFLQRIPGRGLGNQFDGFMKIGKATPVTAKDVKSKVRFSDVAGMKEAKAEITEFVDFLKDPEKYEHLGARLPRGALLSGPPGGGKTLLAKAVAGEANVPFFSMSGSDFIEVFVGVGPSRVRDLFSQARKNAPSIIFIDEIDAIGRRRARGGFAGGANDERENTLNQILVEMDGFTSSTGVVILAGTNRADILDPALTRPGRFDRTVNIEKPDLDERGEIYKIHLKPLKIAPTLDLDELSYRLAALTPGFTGADIANVCNEGAIQAARRRAFDGVDFVDFECAAERVMAGLPRITNLFSEVQRKTIAYHETGHALVGWLLEYSDPVLKVSIMPRSGRVLGFAQSLPDETSLCPKDALLDRIAVILGGRAAEELFMGAITTGAADDLDKVTQLSYAFVSKLGMNPELGLLSFQRSPSDEGQFYRPYSESTAQLIDREVKSLISSQYERVKRLLSDNSDNVHKMAALLFKKETISYHDIVDCVGPRPFSMKEELLRYVTANPRRALPVKEIESSDMGTEELATGEFQESSTSKEGGASALAAAK